MGCFSFVESLYEKKEARHELRHKQKKADTVGKSPRSPRLSPRQEQSKEELVPKKETCTTGGYSCLLEIAPSKKRIPVGLTPIPQRKVLTAEELQTMRENAEVMRRARAEENIRKRVTRAAKREERASKEVTQSTSVPTKATAALDVEDPDIKRLIKRCNFNRRLRKLKYFVKYGTTKPSVIMMYNAWLANENKI